jgi:hypothetical protein
MKQPVRSLLLVVAILTALPGNAQQPTEVFLKGKIKTAGDTTPIVIKGGPDGFPATWTAGVIVDDPDSQAVWHAQADVDGSYKVGPLPPGRYRVCVQASRFSSVVKVLTIDAGAKSFSPSLRPVLPGHETDCPSLSKALLALTPADLKRAWCALTTSGGTWTGAGYSIMLFADGSAMVVAPPYILIGSDDSPKVVRKVIAGGVSDLFKQFYSAGFFSDSSFTFPLASDLPTTKLTFGVDGLSKTLTHPSGAGPEELRLLENKIETLLDLGELFHPDPKNETLFGGVGGVLRLPKPGLTVLLRAAGSGDPDTFTQLIARGQDPAAVDSSGWTALMIAASEGNEEIVDYLLAHGADPNAKSRKGETALMAAAGGWSGNVFLLKALLAAGADPDADNDEGQTALIWAARRARPAVIQALLSAHADVNHRAKDGSTALTLLRTDLGERSIQSQELLRSAAATK